MSDPHGWARTEHDTMVIPTGAGTTAPQGQPYPGQPSPGQPYPGQGAPVGPGGTGAEAAYWQAKYRRQRIWLGVVAGMALLALLGVVGLGFAAYQAVTSNPLVAAAQELGDQLQGGDQAEQDQALPEGLLPEGTLPESPEGQAPGTTGVPLPEPLQDLGAALGITDVGQLLDLAVAQGLMTQEQADALAAAIAMGGALNSLGGGDEAVPEN